MSKKVIDSQDADSEHRKEDNGGQRDIESYKLNVQFLLFVLRPSKQARTFCFVG
jgi:hypothetical protein